MFNLIQFILQIIPILSICFVFVLTSYKVYFKIRSRFNILVNCWFCNQNSKVPYVRRNDWICPQCDQYNGFNNDGDYNREIIEQLDCSINGRSKYYTNPNSYNEFLNINGFCETCNENQRLKIEKLSQFEPKKESNFDNELQIYKSQLETQYRLCPTCERHLVKVLRDKKKMVLGSKLLDFIVKGATNLSNHPQLKIIKQARKSKLKTLIAILLLIMSIVNLFIIIRDLTGIIRKGLGKDFSDPLSRFVLNIISHMLAFMKVIQTYLDKIILQNDFIQKLYLFIKTLIFLSFTIMGIKLPNFNRNGFSVISIPFGSILLAFIHSILDGFRLTRYTILLTIWSFYAGTMNSDIFNEAEIFKLIISIATVILSLPQWRDTQISMDTTGNSFHKIYSDYLDDDSSINDPNNTTLSSNKSCTSSLQSKNSIHPRMRTSSTLSLHHKTQISPYKKFQMNEDQQSYHNRFTPIQQFPTNRSLFSSNIELNRSQLNLNNNHHNQSFCCSVIDQPTSTFSRIPENDHNINFNNSINNTSFDLNNSFHSNNNIIQPISTVMTAQFPSQMNSKFSYSNNSIYNSEQNNRFNLLSPSRFSLTSSRFGSQPSWVSGGYFNNGQQQQQQHKCNSIEKQNCFHTIPAPLNSENLSRASSQSSGFESHASSNQHNGFIGNNYVSNDQQNGLIMGRENSCCNDFDYYSGENFLFQPPAAIQSNFTNYEHSDRADTSIFRQRNTYSKTLNIQPNSPSLNNLNNHLFLYNNKSMSVNSNDGFDWRQKSNRDLTSINSFNLNKINEELPLIQKGSLLKKWQQQHQENCFS